MFAGKKSAQIREILISESAWEEMTCLFAPSLSLVIFDSMGLDIACILKAIDLKRMNKVVQMKLYDSCFSFDRYDLNKNH